MTDTLDHTETRERKLTRREMMLIEGFIPPWLDMDMMCLCLPYTPNTVEKLIGEGVLPPSRMRGGKRVWKWSEVNGMMTAGGRSPDAEAERIENGTRRASEARTGH